MRLSLCCVKLFLCQVSKHTTRFSFLDRSASNTSRCDRNVSSGPVLIRDGLFSCLNEKKQGQLDLSREKSPPGTGRVGYAGRSLQVIFSRSARAGVIVVLMGRAIAEFPCKRSCDQALTSLGKGACVKPWKVATSQCWKC